MIGVQTTSHEPRDFESTASILWPSPFLRSLEDAAEAAMYANDDNSRVFLPRAWDNVGSDPTVH